MHTKKTQKTSNIQYPVSSLYRGGFTIMELMVTVAIFAIVSMVVLVRNSQYDNEVLLSGVAYDVALSIRQTQNYGINVLGQENNFENAYGVHFVAGTDVTTYTLFRDLDGEYDYDAETGPVAGEGFETFTLGRGFTVNRLCDLSQSNCESTLDEVTIIFKRPNPDAIINPRSIDGTGGLNGVGIELVTPRGGSRFITVEATGQISVTRLEDIQEGTGTIDETGTVGI